MSSGDTEFEIYVPLSDNQGVKFPNQLLAAYKSELVEMFSGLSDLKYKGEGIWKIHGVEYNDEIVLWRVYGSDPQSDPIFMKDLKKRMLKDFRQKDILIVKRQVEFI